MNKEAMDYVREDCRRDAMIDRSFEVRRRWPFADEQEEDRIVPYDETEDVRRDDDFNDW